MLQHVIHNSLRIHIDFEKDTKIETKAGREGNTQRLTERTKGRRQWDEKNEKAVQNYKRNIKFTRQKMTRS